MVSVSVALATYNGARFLEAQLESLWSQVRLPDELVVGDDGSTDQTQALLETFARRAPFKVQIQRNAVRLGVADNFAAIISRCEGDIVLPCDQDDVWDPQKIERILEFAQHNPSAWLITHDAAIITESGASTGLTLGTQIRRAGDDPAKAVVAGCCMAIASPLNRMFAPPPRTREHDAWISTVADQLGVRAWIPDVLIQYRRHGDNVSESYMSRVTPAGRLRRIADRISLSRGQPIAGAVARSIASTEDALAAIQRHRSILIEKLGDRRVADAQRTLEGLLDRDRRRAKLHASTGWRRWSCAWWNLRHGTYRGHRGLLSFVRDVIG